MTKITIERETLERAIDALEENAHDENTGRCNGCGIHGSYDKHHDMCKVGAAITELRKALAQPAEPVALLQCEIQPRALNYSLHDYHIAPSKGPLHFQWQDKPHRLLYDLIAAVRFYAAQPAPAAVPPGYVLVPIEPTEAMRKAAHDIFGNPLSRPCYRAMIAAAPSAGGAA